ncbi:hypothetical protein [Rickettsiella endosymbiont of Dermanyssus gallinae]|uniref:hypothetical protein n=1 Tax=Rickettsiella endosymbiont of Dermanyssus gallinae TaxID=2856608 RepID=UPI001C5320C9|nr:hypothetical protein [Rickettsiella endosymbiont of Dermanyssus gallinae]
MGIKEVILLGRINDRSVPGNISRYRALCVADVRFPIFLHLGGLGGTTLSFYQKTAEMISARGESAYLTSCSFDSFVETEPTLAAVSPSEALACLNNYGIFPLTAKTLGDANYLGITLGQPDQTSSNAHNFFLQPINYGAISREKLIIFKELLLSELKEIVRRDPLFAHYGPAAYASDSITITGKGFGNQGKPAFRGVAMQRYKLMVKNIADLLAKFTSDQYTEQYCTKIDESILNHMSSFSTALRKYIVKCSPGETLEKNLDDPLMSSCLGDIEPSPILLSRRLKIPVRLPNPTLAVSNENYDLVELLQLPAGPDGHRHDPVTRQPFHLNQIVPAQDLADKIAAVAIIQEEPVNNPAEPQISTRLS